MAFPAMASQTGERASGFLYVPPQSHGQVVWKPFYQAPHRCGPAKYPHPLLPGGFVLITWGQGVEPADHRGVQRISFNGGC